MSTPQDKAIEALEAEILKLKTEIAIVESERDQIKKEFDTMKVLLREIQYLSELPGKSYYSARKGL